MMSIDFENAVAKAREFAVRAGFADVFLVLSTVNREDDKWVVTFDYGFTPSPTKVTVEIDPRSGKAVGFKKVEPQSL